jgi:hypothetical protein
MFGRGILVSALAAGLAGPAQAVVIDATVTIEVVDVAPALDGIEVGDRFTLELAIDDADADTNDSVGAGQFANLVPSFTATPDPENLGSWDPSGGTYSMTASNFVTNAFADGFTLQLRGTYPAAGAPFVDFDLEFWWPSGIEDSGLGDTFAEQLGLAPGALDLGSTLVFGRLRFEDGEDYFEAVVTPEPEGAAATAALALGAMAARRRARRARPVS